jgi:hypothetical protein
MFIREFMRAGVQIREVMPAESQNSPRSGVLQDCSIVTVGQFYELFEKSAASVFGLLP